ncbi:MAG: hypothetical protein GF401_01645 [Chitinivibrionales bacterium]|nr:hypothetical protein [Chitinivibrionales bacterium]
MKKETTYRQKGELYMFHIKTHIKWKIVVVLFVISFTAYSQTSSLVSLGSNGKLVYATDTKGNKVPDFSYVGYHHGEKPLPNVAVAKTISPVSGDNLSNIQSAIDEVYAMTADANGHKGAVLLRAGTYNVNGSINLKSGVVLRGEGNDAQGSIIIATKPSQHTLIIVKGSNGPSDEPSTRTKITDSYVPIGTKTFNVASGHPFAAGDRILLERKPNQAWIDELGMGTLSQTDPGDSDWSPGSYTIESFRRIVAVNGNEITIDAPIVDHIEEAYAEGFITKYTWSGKIEEAGVENLRLESIYASDEDEDHAWSAVGFENSENCWQKDINAYYFGYACGIAEDNSYKITIKDCEIFDPKSKYRGGRRYAFNVAGGQQVLFENCTAHSGRHDFVSGSRTPGPNVFYNCFSKENTSTNGPHHRWSTGQLYDNVIVTDQLAAENRMNSGSGHGWAGSQIMFWNCEAKDILLQDPPMDHTNWAIGCISESAIDGNGDRSNEPAGVIESEGTHISDIPSLYLAQLNERLDASSTTAPPIIANFNKSKTKLIGIQEVFGGLKILLNKPLQNNLTIALYEANGRQIKSFITYSNKHEFLIPLDNINDCRALIAAINLDGKISTRKIVLFK